MSGEIRGSPLETWKRKVSNSLRSSDHTLFAITHAHPYLKLWPPPPQFKCSCCKAGKGDGRVRMNDLKVDVRGLHKWAENSSTSLLSTHHYRLLEHTPMRQASLVTQHRLTVPFWYHTPGTLHHPKCPPSFQFLHRHPQDILLGSSAEADSRTSLVSQGWCKADWFSPQTQPKW